MARVPYLEPADLPAEKRDALDALSDDDEEGETKADDERAGIRNVYRAMANNPTALEAFRAHGSTLWHEGGLSAVDREIVILATARAANSRYEWHQHVRIAREEGISDEQLLAVSTGALDELDPEHAAIVEYVGRFVDDEVDDEVHDRLAAHYDDEQLTGVAAIAGLYLGLARLLQSLDVEVEAEETFVGWELEDA